MTNSEYQQVINNLVQDAKNTPELRQDLRKIIGELTIADSDERIKEKTQAIERLLEGVKDEIICSSTNQKMNQIAFDLGSIMVLFHQLKQEILNPSMANKSENRFDKELEHEYVSKMRIYHKDPDIEGSHLSADNLLCEFLSKLGYDRLVDAYKVVEKWYA